MTNIEIVKGMYEAFGRGDIAGLVNALSEDIKWVTPGAPAVPYAGSFSGRDRVVRFFEDLDQTTHLDPFMPDQYLEQGDTVVTLGSYTGKAKTSRKPFKSSWSMVFKLRNGKVASFEEHTDTAAIGAAFYEPAKARA